MKTTMKDMESKINSLEAILCGYEDLQKEGYELVEKLRIYKTEYPDADRVEFLESDYYAYIKKIILFKLDLKRQALIDLLPPEEMEDYINKAKHKQIFDSLCKQMKLN